MQKRSRAAVAIAVVALIAAAVLIAALRLREGAAGPVYPLALTTFSQNDVRVDLRLERDSGGRILLAAIYTPLREKFYLYGASLPRRGIEGVGRPTLLELPGDSALQAAGPVEESAAAQLTPIKGFDQPFPIYPEGPVALRLPVKLPTQPGEAKVAITYMSCSKEGICLPPVVNQVLTVTVPGGGR
jgi:hypothetical protein